MKHIATPATAMRWPVCALATTRRAARLLTQLYDSHLSEYGIEAAQFALLMMLDAWAGKGRTELAHALGMDKTTLSRNLKVLVARGWIESVKAESGDGRRLRLSLTPKGRDVLTRAKPGWTRAQDSLRREMSGLEWIEMMRTIDGISRAAKNASVHSEATEL